MKDIIGQAVKLYDLNGYECDPVPAHEGGRNLVYICSKKDKKRIIRVSVLNDRTEEYYLAEAEFVRYLAQNGAPVADVFPSVNDRLVENLYAYGKQFCVCMFDYAKGVLLSENGYRYRENAPLEEYFFRIGKALGSIHRLSRVYSPVHRRPDYFDKYDMAKIDSLISDDCSDLKYAIDKRLNAFRTLPRNKDTYGLVHFDFSDGNYHVDLSTGDITVFDFDNCMYCWYMFDLANLWIHGEGWCRGEKDPKKRRMYMRHYFDMILHGYRTETDVGESMLEKLPLFIDMVLIENIIDEIEVSARDGKKFDREDIEDAAECLINNIPYAGIVV